MILITRPFEKAKLLAQKLKTMNMPTHIDSLLAYKMRTKDFDCNKFSDFIISSTQSVKTLKKNHSCKIKNLRQKNFYVIGNEVAKELERLDIKKIKKIFKSSNDLFSYFQTKKLKNKVFCYFSGNVPNTQLIKKLNQLKIHYKQQVLYTVKPKEKLLKKTVELLRSCKIKIVLMYSVYTAETYLTLIMSQKLNKKAKDIIYICLSNNIALILKDHGYKRVLYSKSPTEKSILQMIKFTY